VYVGGVHVQNYVSTSCVSSDTILSSLSYLLWFSPTLFTVSQLSLNS